MKLRIFYLACILAGSAVWAQSTAWQVKFLAGPAWPGGRKVEMTVSPDSLKIEAAKRPGQKPLVIPMSAVKGVIYSRVEFNRGKAMSGAPLMVGGYPPQGVAGANAAYLLVVGIASGMHGQKHYISVQWEQEGVEQEMMVEAPKEEAPKLIEELQAAAGTKWMNLERQCAKAMDDISQQRDKAFSLELDKPASFQSFRLAPGVYQAVLLERSASQGDLYLFADSIEAANLKAIAVVDFAPADSGVAKPVAKLTQSSQLVEIRTAERTLRIR
jgi:hypothetical protein